MTISTLTRRVSFTGTGAVSAFPFAFKVFQGSDIDVVRADALGGETLLTLGSDYTVSLNSNQDANPGGTVTLIGVNSPLAVGQTLALLSDVPPTQLTDLQNGGGFLPTVINAALDKLTILAQQVAERAGRAIVGPQSEAGSLTLPSAAQRANKTLAFDENGGVIAANIQPGTFAGVAKAGDTMTGPLVVPALTSSGQVTAQQVVIAGSNVSPFSFRNKIINGRMDIAQRGVSFPAAPSGTFMVDRFTYQTAGTTAVATATQEPVAPPSNEFQFSAQIVVTTADAAVAAGDAAIIEQRIEGFNARDLIGRPITLSFWVRSAKTGTHCVGFRNNLNDRSFVATYTVSAANTWEFKSVTVSAGLITAGGWNWTNGVGLSISWTLMAGTTFQTGTAGAWQTGNAVATAAQVNVLDAVGNVFNLTGVQLEVGSVATPFENRPISEELSACQRYYETGTFEHQGHSALAGIVDHCNGPVGFRVTKRAAPTILKSAAVFSSCGDQGGGTNTDSFRQFVRTSTAVSFYAGYVWAASAEL